MAQNQSIYSSAPRTSSLWTSSSQKMVPGLASQQCPPESLLETSMLSCPHLRPSESETLGGGDPEVWVVTSPLGDPSTCSSLRTSGLDNYSVFLMSIKVHLYHLNDYCRAGKKIEEKSSYTFHMARTRNLEAKTSL